MAQVSGTLLTTTPAVGNREQLLDAIYMVYRNEVPFTADICGRADAMATYVEWQTDDMPTANANNAVTEGADAGTASNFNPTRVGNYTQLFESVAQVSSTQETVKKAGRSSEMGRQIQLSTRKVLRDIEAAATSENDATSGATRKMQGLAAWLATNTDHAGDGSTTTAGVVTDGTQRELTKDMLDGVMQSIAEQGGATGVSMTMLVGAYNKRQVDGLLSTSNNRDIMATKKQVEDAVDVWGSSYGPVKIVYSPQQRDRDLFIVQDDMFDMAYLQPLGTTDLAKTGHSVRKMVSAECTLVSRNEKASGKVADLLTA